MRRPLRSRLPIALSAAALLALAGCAGAPESEQASPSATAAFPVTVTSCGHTTTVSSKPKRVVTLNQGATETVLALGLSSQLIGTAYLDDAISPKWQAAYDAVPVLAKEYPTHEDLLAVDPDFIYASYASAFDDKVAGSQDDLAAQGINSYLSPFGCTDTAQRPTPSFDAVWDESDAIAQALGDPAAGQKLRTEQQATLDTISGKKAGAGLKALWYDSGEKTPLVGGGGSGPQLILDTVGATNIFADIDAGWADGNWEDVVAADPDFIVLADASWSSAESKKEYLENDKVLSQLTAVKNAQFVTVPYSEATPGARMVDGAVSVSDQLTGLNASK